MDRPALTQFLQPRDLPIVAGSDKTLLNDVSPGTDVIQLSNRQGLAVGDVLQIDVDQLDLTEFVEVMTVPVTSAPDQPTLIALNHELMQSHRRDAVVKVTLPQPPGIPSKFTVDATTGDTVRISRQPDRTCRPVMKFRSPARQARMNIIESRLFLRSAMGMDFTVCHRLVASHKSKFMQK